MALPASRRHYLVDACASTSPGWPGIHRTHVRGRLAAAKPLFLMLTAILLLRAGAPARSNIGRSASTIASSAERNRIPSSDGLAFLLGSSRARGRIADVPGLQPSALANQCRFHAKM
jgi:hypothetical protein